MSFRSFRIGMLSTYPPTLCGLATFTSALRSALVAAGHRVDVVRVDDGSGPPAPSARRAEVTGVLVQGSASSRRRAVGVLSQSDVAVIQHEYGIFGGPDGDEVLDVLRDLEVPALVVLHTVPQHASGHQAEVLVEVCARAAAVVVMSDSARDRLVRTYFPIDESKVVTIPHGARLADHVVKGLAPVPSGSPRLLTWGLIGPGKGLEHMIDALGLLFQLGKSVRYTIAGSVHPKVLAREGTRYLDSVLARAHARGVDHLVTYDGRYRGVAELTEFIASYDAVVMPYDTREQVTSGVLVDSIAAGRAVIATEFPHAVELLGEGAGILVPHQDPRSLAVAIHTLLVEPDELVRLQARARDIAPTLGWQAVATEYARVVGGLVRSQERSRA